MSPAWRCCGCSRGWSRARSSRGKAASSLFEVGRRTMEELRGVLRRREASERSVCASAQTGRGLKRDHYESRQADRSPVMNANGKSAVMMAFGLGLAGTLSAIAAAADTGSDAFDQKVQVLNRALRVP